MSEPLLQLHAIQKSFADNSVLKGIEMQVLPGQVFALIGGNGAGKSTLMKIITGLYKANAGQMKIRGEAVHFHSPSEAHKHGVYLVPQEPLIFPNMTVEENIAIGLKQPKKEVIKKIRHFNCELGWNLDLKRTASTLSIAEQQLVELLRGLVRDAKLLILDEPTSTLTPHEITALFKTIRKLSHDGKGIIYITHRFTEIFELAHHVAVLRDGVISASGPVSEFTYEKLVQSLMPAGAGYQTRNLVNTRNDTGDTMNTKPVLEVADLFGKRFQFISFSVHEGEVVGIAGIVGAGRTELAEAIFGICPHTSGEIRLSGQRISRRSVRERMRAGLVYVPEDRNSHGIFPIASLKGNLSSSTLHTMRSCFFPFKEEKELARHYIQQLKVKSTDSSQTVDSLSGGNQQKVVLGKVLAAHPKVILLDEPTRGIDASARLDIYERISSLKKQGMGIVLISSDLEEIIALSDHVLVMHEGKIVKKLEGDDLTLPHITSASFGVNEEVSL